MLKCEPPTIRSIPIETVKLLIAILGVPGITSGLYIHKLSYVVGDDGFAALSAAGSVG